MSRLTRISALLAFFFALDKGAGLLRQVIIARQFGLSPELDAFNVANNIPDLLYAVISGGALALAFIPVLSATLARDGRDASWRLFSQVANLVFIVTATLASIAAVISGPLVHLHIIVGSQLTPDQENVVITLMRLNLIATIIFSISGLVMSGLQANQHFLFPAMAPLFYNFGQIFGALVLAPEKGYSISGIQLPALGLGVNGLVYGVILGSFLHLAIQFPGLILYRFRWSLSLGLKTKAVWRVLSLMGPRVFTVFFIQMIFITRDRLATNLAPASVSGLTAGAVTALTYGWMVQQVPETLIATAIGTAILPTLSQLSAEDRQADFHATIERALRILAAITLPVAVVMGVGLGPLLAALFNFGPEGTQVLLWTTRGFLAGLLGHSFMEVASRAFYARQDALTPLVAAGVNMLAYIALGALLYRPLGPAGISLTDAICFTGQALILLAILSRRMGRPFNLGSGVIRAVLGAAVGGLVTWGLLQVPLLQNHAVPGGLLALAAGGAAALPFIWKEARLLLRL